MRATKNAAKLHAAPSLGERDGALRIRQLESRLEDRGRDLACVARETSYAMRVAVEHLNEDISDTNQKREDLLAVIFFWIDALTMAQESLHKALEQFGREEV